MDIIFRKANHNDINSINLIYNLIHDNTENGSLHTGWIRNVYPTKFDIINALERNDIFVEEVGGKIVGSAIINNIQLDEYKNVPWNYSANTDEIMVIHTLVINPTSKGCGFGQAFMNFYENYARKNNCKCLRLDTNEINLTAINFYKKLNFSEITIIPCTFQKLGIVNLVFFEKIL